MRRPARLLSIIFTAVLTALFAIVAAHAQQSQTFHTQLRGGGQDFAYTYTTGKQQTQSLGFRLNADDIARGSAEFRAWDDSAARDYAIKAVQKRAAELETPNLKASVQGLPTGMNLRLSGYNLSANSPQVQRLEKELNTTYTTTIQSYATQNMYRATPQGENRTLIGPNHAAVAIRYTAAMAPVARAIQEQGPGAAESPRAFINAALSWLQAIPYDTLNDRATSNGAGFQTPYGLMLGNSGDCDTKATALAALIRAAYPSTPLAIVYVPQHAFLAIGLPQTPEDYALRTEYGTFVLADATGPGRTPLGYIDEPTRQKIRNAKTDLLPIR